MKSLLIGLLALLFAPLSTFAQKTFEGIITYEVSLNGENASQMAIFMPTAYEYKIRDNLIRFHMEGGMTAALLGDILINTKKGEAFMIKEAEQIAYRIQDTEETATPPLIEASEEVLTILGYPCKKYTVTTPGEGKASVQYIWATSDIRIEKPQKKNGKTPSGAGQLLIDGLDGFPLKIMTPVPEGNLVLVLTASKVDLQRISKSDMEFPKEFEVKDFDPSMFGEY